MKLSEIYIRDPFILPYKGTYYLYGKKAEDALNFCVYESKDLKNWSNPITVFEPSADFWATRDFWAPEVHYYQGKFYMFASFKSEERCRGTQILVSDCPTGPFLPITQYPVTPEEWECLDGTLYVDQAEQPYMVFCHEWLQIKNGTVCYAPLSEDFRCFLEKPKKLFAAADYSFVRPTEENGECFVTDGVFFYRSTENELFLLWSSVGEHGYLLSVLKSDNGELNGNWLAQPLLFEQDGGHGMLFRTFDGELKLILHTPNGPSGEERGVLFSVKEINGNLQVIQ